MKFNPGRYTWYHHSAPLYLELSASVCHYSIKLPPQIFECIVNSYIATTKGLCAKLNSNKYCFQQYYPNSRIFASIFQQMVVCEFEGGRGNNNSSTASYQAKYCELDLKVVSLTRRTLAWFQDKLTNAFCNVE